MTSKEALREAQTGARLGRVEVSRHARTRMSQRGVKAEDLRTVIVSATSATEQKEDGEQRWRLEGGKDLDAEELTVVVAFRFGVTVVTVF